ncbi:pyridoxine 5'-phosphate synthase, partial [Sodalis-like endosymbiont of Proechinophthirus fluctus]|uniref:pyridoxine 5'-phosphate synthase n=1 Tax=Sodalis-like endosymbiont of Proechinophthirus fluctus TaxID=1462730 RepID=UPI001FCA5C12
VADQRDKLRQTVARLSDAGIQVSLFIDADEHQIAAAAEVGAPYIEIHTGAYAVAANETSRAAEFARISQGAQYATALGLKVNAGHGLDYHNVKLVATLVPIQELNIGHAIISRAVIGGLAEAVRYMKRLMREARG